MDQTLTQLFAIVIPVFIDWASAKALLEGIDKVPLPTHLSFHVILANDGSYSPDQPSFDIDRCRLIRQIETLNLVCNLGHRRVIAVGLVAAAKLPNIAGVIVMDGDGEDRPEDIRVLLQEAARQPSHIDCARRRKRSESLLFASRTASTKRSFSPATCISAMDQHRKAGSDVHYAGSELTLFSAAVNWKSYVAHMIGPYIHGRVLEVGAGLGINIPHLLSASVIHWLAMEPDPDLAAVIEQKIRKRELPPSCQVINGTLDAVGLPERFDTILYLDVLEHIADDAAELRHAARHLAPNGTLIVLAPPHRFLFSAFDQAIGHYRRYTNGPNE